MQILDQPPECTTLTIEMASAEKQAHDEPSSTEVSSTTSLPKIPSLARIATQHANTEEVTTTPVNSPETSNPSLDSSVQAMKAVNKTGLSEASKPKVRMSEMEEMSPSHVHTPGGNRYHDELNFDQYWYHQNQHILPIALARLIAARDKVNRQNNQEQVILGMNFFTPSTQLEDTADLYHSFNEVCMAVMDYCDEKEYRYYEKKYGPQLPLGFRDASAQDRPDLSRQAFAKLMVDGIEENPWKTFEITKIVQIEDLKSLMRAHEQGDDRFTNSSCAKRTGHFCRKGVCNEWSGLGLEALASFEGVQRYAEEALKSLSGDDPNIYKATKKLEYIQGHVLQGLQQLNAELSGNARGDLRREKCMSKIVDGVLSGQDVKHLFAPNMLPPEGREQPWVDRTVQFLRYSYTSRKELYDVHLIIAATQQNEEDEEDDHDLLPANFCQNWGYEDRQREASAVFVQQKEAEHLSDLLQEAGWGPAIFFSMVDHWLHHVHNDGNLLDDHHDAVIVGNEALREAIAAQAITYLCCHLWWYAKTQNNTEIKPSDPSWEWHVKMIPENVDQPSFWHNPPDPCTQMYNK